MSNGTTRPICSPTLSAACRCIAHSCSPGPSTAPTASSAISTRAESREAIHGNKSQNGRQRALANFAADKVPVLVATDIASRGIDVDGITHVVNYDLTHEPETYVHRIGRTGRAGASGSAVSFCDREEVSNLRAIERLRIRRPIPSAVNPLPSTAKEIAPRPAAHRDENQHRPHRAAAPARHPARATCRAHHVPQPPVPIPRVMPISQVAAPAARSIHWPVTIAPVGIHNRRRKLRPAPTLQPSFLSCR